MSNALVIVVVVVVLAVAVVVLLGRRRGSDGVESFRRQIDALGPEARRGVVDQVNQAVDPETDDDDRSRRWRVVRRDVDGADPDDGQTDDGQTDDEETDDDSTDDDSTDDDVASDDDERPTDGA